MASVSSLSNSSSSSSIYGNRTYNIISGLASGLDTEELISGLVQSYQQKIQSLQKDNTKLQWQKDAYRSISDKLVEFSRNYCSFAYGSTTNLLSNSFFTNAVKTTTNYADLVSAIGKSSSQVTINSISTLATATQYTISGSTFNKAVTNDGKTATGETMGLNSNGNVEVSKLAGSLSLSYGDQSISLSFDERDYFNKADGNYTFDAAKFKQDIEEQLKTQKVTVDGKETTADTLLNVDVKDDGTISFISKDPDQSVAVTGASGNLAGMITGLDSVIEHKGSAIKLNDTTVTEEKTLTEYFAGKSLSVTLNDTTKTITLPENSTDFITDLNTALNKAFGTDKLKAELSPDKNTLSFTAADSNSTFSVTAPDANMQTVLGIGSGLTNYVDTKNKTLKDLGIALGTGELKINGTLINTYDENATLEQIMKDINNSDAGVEVSYSKTSGQFVFTASETGAGHDINIDGDLGTALFSGGKLTDGTDATLNVTVNGQTMDITRSSNTFDIDGMSVTLNGTFTPASDTDKITFTSKTDADTVVDAVKKMVTDLNALLSEIKSAYSDVPLKQSNGSAYEPLSDEDMADMSETAIKNYEEKAKTGILFMDSDLSSLYNALRSAITPGGADGEDLRSIGLNTSYSDGLTTITLDEKALREALETDPDKVQEIFTKSTSTGSSTDGLMAKLQSITDKYASTTGSTKGILIEKAGSKYSPTSELKNTMLDKMENVEEQIAKWQDKLSNQVDYYTNKFTQLEMLINQMNSQSSALSGLMGG